MEDWIRNDWISHEGVISHEVLFFVSAVKRPGRSNLWGALLTQAAAGRRRRTAREISDLHFAADRHLGLSCLEKWHWVGVAGEETETRTIDLNLNTIQKKTINSRRKNTGVIYLGGSENIKFFQVTSGGVIEETYWKHTEKTSVSSQGFLWHTEVMDIYYITNVLQLIKPVNTVGLLQSERPLCSHSSF